MVSFVRSTNLPLTGHTKNVRVRRGTKAGRRFIRHIHTVYVDRSRYVKYQQSSVNMGNLVCITCDAPNTHISGPDEPREIVPIPPVDDQCFKTEENTGESVYGEKCKHQTTKRC